MVIIAKLENLNFDRFDAVVAAQFQPQTGKSLLTTVDAERASERLAAASGTTVNIWVVSLTPQSILPEEASLSTKHLTTSQAGKQERQCVFQSKSHAPNDIVALSWSPNGSLLASCDARQIFIFKFIRYLPPPQDTLPAQSPTKPSEELWKISVKITDPICEFFDLSWFGNQCIVTALVDGIKVWNIRDQSVLMSSHICGGFVKGLSSWYPRYIAAQDNDRKCTIWRRKAGTENASNLDFEIISEVSDELLKSGPIDIPYYRRPSFDCTGNFVVFPYGERLNHTFGFMHDLLSPLSPAFRFRGHAARVNCVAMSSSLWLSPANTVFTLYAQASIDTALSIWRVYYPPSHLPNEVIRQITELKPPEVPAECYLILKPNYLDEQASVTALSWNNNGSQLVVASDDGSMTLLQIAATELEGTLIKLKDDDVSDPEQLSMALPTSEPKTHHDGAMSAYVAGPVDDKGPLGMPPNASSNRQTSRRITPIKISN